MISVINKNSSATAHLDENGTMHFWGYKYPQDLDTHQAYVLALELIRRSDIDESFTKDWQNLYELGQDVHQKKIQK